MATDSLAAYKHLVENGRPARAGIAICRGPRQRAGKHANGVPEMTLVSADARRVYDGALLPTAISLFARASLLLGAVRRHS